MKSRNPHIEKKRVSYGLTLIAAFNLQPLLRMECIVHKQISLIKCTTQIKIFNKYSAI